MLRERGNTSSTRKIVIDPRISYELGKIKQLIPRVTYGTSFPPQYKVGDIHYYQGATENGHVANNWYAGKPGNDGWQSINATSVTGENISGAIPTGVTIADYLSKFGGTMEGVISFFKDQKIPASALTGKIPAGVTIEDYLGIYGGTMLGPIIMAGLNIVRAGKITGYDTAIEIDLSTDGQMKLSADTLSLIGALALTGAMTISTTLALALGAAINEFSIDGALVGNSDSAVPTEKAVKTYADTKTTLTAVLADAGVADAITKKHDGTVQLAKNGISGSFTTVDLKTVTVVDGQIISIV